MEKVYTVNAWTVKRGLAREFVAAWKNFGKWIVKQPGSTKSVRLFRDLGDPGHFMSVDSWENEKAFKTARATNEFARQRDNLGKFLEDFSSWPLKLEAEEKS